MVNIQKKTLVIGEAWNANSNFIGTVSNAYALSYFFSMPKTEKEMSGITRIFKFGSPETEVHTSYSDNGLHVFLVAEDSTSYNIF